jgi:hypothetical protein
MYVLVAAVLVAVVSRAAKDHRQDFLEDRPHRRHASYHNEQVRFRHAPVHARDIVIYPISAKGRAGLKHVRTCGVCSLCELYQRP